MTGHGWRVRRAEVADADAIGRLQVRSWRLGYRGIMPPEVLDALDPIERGARWRQILDASPGTTYVAERDGSLGAFCSVGPVREPERDGLAEVPTGEMYALYADPDAYGSGAGHAAHDAGVELLRANGFRHLVLWVLVANPRARAFYERHGWRADEGVEQDDHGAPGVRVIRYSRPALSHSPTPARHRRD